MTMHEALLYAAAKPALFGARMIGITKGGAYFMRAGSGIRNFRWHTPEELETKGFKGGKSLMVTNWDVSQEWEVVTLNELKLEVEKEPK